MVPYANNIRCLQPDVDCKHWLIFVENEKISEDMSSAACVCVVCFDEIKCGKIHWQHLCFETEVRRLEEIWMLGFKRKNKLLYDI